MLFSGSSITNGHVEAIVVRTGMNTELGRIAISLNTPYEVETPLQLKIKEISKKITILIFIILNYAPLVLGILGLTHSFKYPFSPIFLTLLNICFGLYCVIFLYANILLYQNGHTQVKADETKALLICRKHIKSYDYLMLVFLFFFFLFG